MSKTGSVRRRVFTGPMRAAVTLVLLLMGCTSENDLSLPAPPVGYPTAYATRDCAPADGPAVRVFLAAEPGTDLPPPVPFVDVAIWQDPGSVSNHKFEWTGPSSDGNARRCSATDACEPASQVVVQFRPVASDSSVSGTMTLTFADGSTIAGGFNASWRSSSILCG